MSRMVRIRGFKRFEEVEFRLPGHVVLAGPSDTGKTTVLLAIAWKRKLHVPGLMTGARPHPRRLPDHSVMGSQEEAVACVLQNKENWSATPGALEWLSEAASAFPPPERKRR